MGCLLWWHYSDVIMRAMASQITDVLIVCSTVCWGTNQRKQQSSASLAFARGIHRWWVDSPHKGPVTRKIFPFNDVAMIFEKINSVVTAPYCILHQWRVWYPCKNAKNWIYIDMFDMLIYFVCDCWYTTLNIRVYHRNNYFVRYKVVEMSLKPFIYIAGQRIIGEF